MEVVRIWTQITDSFSILAIILTNPRKPLMMQKRIFWYSSKPIIGILNTAVNVWTLRFIIHFRTFEIFFLTITNKNQILATSPYLLNQTSKTEKEDQRFVLLLFAIFWLPFPVCVDSFFDLSAKLYTPSTPNIDLIQCHTHLNVCA